MRARDIRRRVCRWQARFRLLRSWVIEVRVGPEVLEDHGAAAWVTCSRTMQRGRRAVMGFVPRATTDDVILHELLHVAHWELQRQQERRGLCGKAAEELLVQDVCRLVRGEAEVLDPGGRDTDGWVACMQEVL